MSGRLRPRNADRWIAFGLLGAGLLIRPWVQPGSFQGEDGPANVSLVVTSGEDAGPGTLREALFTANRAEGTAEITFEVDEVRLTSPLPPLAGGASVRIGGDQAQTVLRNAEGSDVPLLDVATTGVTVSNLVMEGSGGTCLQATRSVRIIGVIARGCGIGVLLGGEAQKSLVTGSTFEGNETGMRLEGALADVEIRENRFLANGSAGLSISGGALEAAGTPVRVIQNHFEDDRVSVLLVNASVLVTGNDFIGAREAAVYTAGPGAVVSENRMKGGQGVGVMVYEARRTRIAENEITGYATAGISIEGGSGTTVRSNRSHRNGYGILVRFTGDQSPHAIESNTVLGNQVDGIMMLGASPLVRGNTFSGNGGAGVRLVAWAGGRDEARRASRPLLEDNALDNNTLEGVVRDGMRE